MGLFTIVPIIFFTLLIIISAFFIVKQQTAVIVERFGKFQSIRQSGLQIKIPLVDRISGRLSLKIQQLDVIIETKTLDDVFVRLKVSVQYKVIKDRVYDAFYKLDYPHDQITSYVFDVVRAEVPKMKLDDVFVKKDDIALAVKAELNDAMSGYGFDIIKTLVTDIDPDAQVKQAMNRINASEREKIAAQFEGDAARILIVEKAKAEAESKRLQGQGIADQRREIARGLEESVEVLNKVGINSQEASALIVVDCRGPSGEESRPAGAAAERCHRCAIDIASSAAQIVLRAWHAAALREADETSAVAGARRPRRGRRRPDALPRPARGDQVPRRDGPVRHRHGRAALRHRGEPRGEERARGGGHQGLRQVGQAQPRAAQAQVARRGPARGCSCPGACAMV